MSSDALSGPLFVARDTHALSEPAFRTIVEVLAAGASPPVGFEQVLCWSL